MTTTRRDFVQRAGLAAGALLCNAGMIDDVAGVRAPENASPLIHYDSDGLIVHKRGPSGALDGGDTAQREGWYWFGVWIRDQPQGPKDRWTVPKRTLTFPAVLRLLEPGQDGVFYRHPKLAPWNNPYDKDFGFSRTR